MDGWMDGWMDGRMNGYRQISIETKSDRHRQKQTDTAPDEGI